MCNAEAMRCLEDIDVTTECIYPHWAILATFRHDTFFDKVSKVELPKEIPVKDIDKSYLEAAAKEAEHTPNAR